MAAQHHNNITTSWVSQGLKTDAGGNNRPPACPVQPSWCLGTPARDSRQQLQPSQAPNWRSCSCIASRCCHSWTRDLVCVYGRQFTGKNVQAVYLFRRATNRYVHVTHVYSYQVVEPESVCVCVCGGIRGAWELCGNYSERPLAHLRVM